ncbi:hypothetical protein NX773_09800 [Massilia solisilvae]|uniref:Uncharacterized protein n=1 Tax=Massilia solisilvae TaxID=1811225 RepID=A0ABT2BIW3_9BURK|nr:hypothetical protein [Massilia solisilvae]MCS0608455.1 hypothetical protein [Massilia solisilvae]
MKRSFFVYAIVVTAFSTIMSWTNLVSASSGGGGSNWSSHSRGGYSGGWSGGGGHK